MILVFDFEPEFLEVYELCREQTMTSIERMYALYTAVNYVIENRLPGHFIECGVWRGGSVMLMLLTLLRRGERSRPVWLYDTFSGMTAPGESDVESMSGRSARDILAEPERSNDDPFRGVAPRAVVEENIRRTGYPL